MSQAETAVLQQADAAAESLARVKHEVGQAIFGQERMIELTLCAVLAGGHALLVGAPGLAKTTLVNALATALNLPWSRVQFTPDLMPADIVGSEVLEEDDKGKRNFRFIPGPVFTSLLMADEINRASPRTQSALLQAMQERHVTVNGLRYDLPQPFHVLATQNPIEQDGTYPLPEAQLDRFLLQIETPFPDKDTERRILIETTGSHVTAIGPALPPDGLLAIQNLVRQLPVGEKVVEAILRLVRSARPDQDGSSIARENVAWGPGPRAGQALMLACRSRALLRGRIAPSLDDVVALARPALAHRMALNFNARADGITVESLIDKLAEEAA